jgi:acyl-CoA thioesterase-1
MNKKIRLLAIVIAIMIVSTGIAAFILQTVGNKKPPANLIRVACVGDSITEGTEYPDDLWMLLGANYTVGNFGVGGATVSLDAQKPYINETAFQNAKQFQPNIVIIMLGTNDARPDFHRFNASFVEDYIKLVRGFQALASKPQIWIVKPPPIFNNGTGLSTEFFSLNVIPAIERVANEADLPIINVYSTLTNHSDLFRDGVHPNSEGSKLIADAVYKAIIFQNNSGSLSV